MNHEDSQRANAPLCRNCGVELTEDNWYPSRRKKHNYICKECVSKQSAEWQKRNPEKARAQSRRWRYKHGGKPFNENRECPQYLGIHVAERVLSHVFKDVERMPPTNPGYDFICSKKKKIDVKSSTLHKDGSWLFRIRRNTVADYFLCLAFDNRNDLNPLHVWLVPGSKLNHLSSTSISPSTIHKWDGYRLDISKVHACCTVLRGD